MNTTIRHAFVALALVAGSATASFAGEECTAETLQAKAMEASTAMQQLAATDPEKLQEIATELQELQTSAATANGDYSELCDAYDSILEDIKG